MPGPTNLKTLNAKDALSHLSISGSHYETSKLIKQDKMIISVASDISKLPSNSPYGAFTNIHLPFSADEKMRRQFALLNLPKLRVGKIIEMLDCFAADTAKNYTKDFEDKNSYFVTAVVDGLTQRK
jgi:hypothetical protein